jgi:hypothetical protein
MVSLIVLFFMGRSLSWAPPAGLAAAALHGDNIWPRIWFQNLAERRLSRPVEHIVVQRGGFAV